MRRRVFRGDDDDNPPPAQALSPIDPAASAVVQNDNAAVMLLQGNRYCHLIGVGTVLRTGKRNRFLLNKTGIDEDTRCFI